MLIITIYFIDRKPINSLLWASLGQWGYNLRPLIYKIFITDHNIYPQNKTSLL